MRSYYLNMNPYFSRQEGMAVLSILADIATADELTMGEAGLMSVIGEKLGLANQRDLDQVKNLSPRQVIPIISQMSYEKRKLVTCMMLMMVFQDGRLSEEEKVLYPEIASQCNLTIDEDIMPQEAHYLVGNWLNS